MDNCQPNGIRRTRGRGRGGGGGGGGGGVRRWRSEMKWIPLKARMSLIASLCECAQLSLSKKNCWLHLLPSRAAMTTMASPRLLHKLALFSYVVVFAMSVRDITYMPPALTRPPSPAPRVQVLRHHPHGAVGFRAVRRPPLLTLTFCNVLSGTSCTPPS
jgi:hypothetical protein